MRNVLAIVKRDARRLLRVPSAWVIIFGLVFIPPLYAWFNVLGFWDPYGNTSNIHVAIVNEDKGADNDIMGEINLGRQIVTQLKGNKQLGWQFVDHDEAMDQVKSGRSYAAIVIPEDFSDQVSAVISDTSARPKLKYYVNEKANAIATKVTDTGASTVDKQVNNTFVSTVSKVVSSAVNETSSNIDQLGATTSYDTVSDVNTVQDNIAKARATIHDVSDELGKLPQETQSARQALAQVQRLQARAAQDVSSTSALITGTQGGLNNLIQSSSTNLDQASALLSQASGQANGSVAKTAALLTEANGTVGTSVDKAQDINKTTAELIQQLEDFGLPGTEDIIAQFKEQNKNMGQSITNLQQLNKDTGSTVTNTASLADALNSATQKTLQTNTGLRHSVISGALPQFNNGLSTLAQASSGLSNGLSSQGSVAAQAETILDQLDRAAASTKQSLGSADKYLQGLQGKLDTVGTDLSAMGSSNALSKIFGKNGQLDVAKIADFMLSPTVLDTKVVYPVASYGSGMAPLFVNLSLWVGAFMLMVIFKLEVDDDDIADPTPRERYWGRWLLLAPIAAVQGLVTTAGSVLIGVQTVSPPLFILTGMVASLVYLSVVYALSTTFMHVGKALCIVLVILQIPGASGLYPIEMMPAFFRKSYPFFPFTYSINALRETIGGFYHNDWALDMAKLLVFALLFFFLGLFVRPRLNNLNRLFAHEIEASDMFVTEPVTQISHEFRLSQAISVLADQKEYRQTIVARASHFATLYPRLKRGALIAGVVVPAILAVTFSVTNGTMLVALAAWVIWILVIIAFLMAIEMMRDSLVRQIRLGTLSQQTIRGMLHTYDKPRRNRYAQPRPSVSLAIPRPPAPAARNTDNDDTVQDSTAHETTAQESSDKLENSSKAANGREKGGEQA